MENETTTEAPIEVTAPDAGEVTPVAPAEAPVIPDGQAPVEDAKTTETVPNPFDERWNGFIQKKGWKPEMAQQQLLDSYEHLESKLGNFSEVSEKAQLWDAAQRNLEQLQLKGQIDAGQFDFTKAPVEQLAELWKDGKVSLADFPPQRQFEVQKHVTEQEYAQREQARVQEEHYKSAAQALVEKYPILKNPDISNIVASYIEGGMEPDQAVSKVQDLLGGAERKGEERIKKDIEMVKQGNLERTTSAAPTKPKRVIKSVRDAFLAAKDELAGN